jgi:hypothetical protein
MARSSKTPVILVLILLIIIAYVSYTVYISYDSFRNIDCAGVNCKEGEFCENNTCKALSPPNTNNYM